VSRVLLSEVYIPGDEKFAFLEIFGLTLMTKQPPAQKVLSKE
jgi:hypothetical protein